MHLTTLQATAPTSFDGVFQPWLLRERLALTGRRLWREIKERGYAGGYTAVTDMLRELRPSRQKGFSFDTSFSRTGSYR